MHLIDQILCRHPDPNEVTDTQTILADNVYHYYMVDNPKDKWSVTDFPNLAPPFENFFVEGAMPSMINNNGNLIPRPAHLRGVRTGVHFVAMEFESPEQIEYTRHYFKQIGYQKALPIESAKWCLRLTPYAGDGKTISHAPGHVCLFIDDQGAVIPLDPPANESYTMYILDPKYNHLSETDAQKLLHDMNESSPMMIYPALLTISFMHCKNVYMERQRPPAALSKKHERRHGKPLCTWRTLTIEPMKKILRTEGKSESVGLPRSLHICHGHFKDYTKGKGLFGKHHGNYWWPWRVQGDPETGVSGKDYKVIAPITTKAK